MILESAGIAALAGAAGMKLFDLLGQEIQTFVSAIIKRQKTKAADKLAQELSETSIDKLLREGILSHLSEFGFSETVRDQLAQTYKLLYLDDDKREKSEFKLRAAADNLVELWKTLDTYSGNKREFLEAALCAVLNHSLIWKRISPSQEEIQKEILSRGRELVLHCVESSASTALLRESPVLQISLCTAVSELNQEICLAQLADGHVSDLVDAQFFCKLYQYVKELCSTDENQKLLKAATFKKHQEASEFRPSEELTRTAQLVTESGALIFHDSETFKLDPSQRLVELFDNAEVLFDKAKTPYEKAVIAKGFWFLSKTANLPKFRDDYEAKLNLIDLSNVTELDRQELLDFGEFQNDPRNYGTSVSSEVSDVLRHLGEAAESLQKKKAQKLC